MGAGGIDSWARNAYPMAPYRMRRREAHSYRYRLTPVEGAGAERKAREKF